MPEALITIASTQVGRLTADPLRVAGLGGPIDPTLVVTLDVRLDPHQPGAPTLALHWLEARLRLPGSPPGTPRFGPIAFRYTGALGHATIHSLPSAASRTLEISFPLSERQVRAFEELAHRSNSDQVEIAISFVGVVCAVGGGGPLTLRGDEGSGYLAGNVYDLRPIAETRIGDLGIQVPREHWAKAILPGLGLDRLRLVAVRLPDHDPFPEAVITRFDAARHEYDAGRYEQSIIQLRKVREAVEKTLHASRANTIADQLAARLGWARGRLDPFDEIWTALRAITNEAAHADDQPPRPYHPAEARGAILLAATALEYLGDLLSTT